MTICAAVKVRDGIALGTDSMTQVFVQTAQGQQVAKGYSNARKLFQVSTLPIGVMTYGLGNIGPRSNQGLLLEFSATYTAAADVKTVTDQLFQFLGQAFQASFGATPPQNQVLGCYVAGYSPNQPLPDEWEFRLPLDKTTRQVGHRRAVPRPPGIRAATARRK